MAAARVFRPENRLGKVLSGADSVSTTELVAAAERNTSRIADQIRAHVRDKVALLLTFANAGEAILFAECMTLGAAALAVAEVAGAVGMAAVGEVARGIYQMVEGLSATGALHIDGLRVHLDCLSIVSQGDGDLTPEADVILVRLAVMRRAIGVKD